MFLEQRAFLSYGLRHFSVKSRSTSIHRTVRMGPEQPGFQIAVQINPRRALAGFHPSLGN